MAAPGALPEPPDEEYPLLLLTGRGSSAQWHTQTRTGKSGVLRKLHSLEPYVEVNPQDASRLEMRPARRWRSYRAAAEWQHEHLLL